MTNTAHVPGTRISRADALEAVYAIRARFQAAAEDDRQAAHDADDGALHAIVCGLNDHDDDQYPTPTAELRATARNLDLYDYAARRAIKAILADTED